MCSLWKYHHFFITNNLSHGRVWGLPTGGTESWNRNLTKKERHQEEDSIQCRPFRIFHYSYTCFHKRAMSCGMLYVVGTVALISTGHQAFSLSLKRRLMRLVNFPKSALTFPSELPVSRQISSNPTGSGDRSAAKSSSVRMVGLVISRLSNTIRSWGHHLLFPFSLNDLVPSDPFFL